MFRSVGSKVAWVGRTASMVLGLALVLGLLFGVASMALAGTGVGAVFNLGKLNQVGQMSQLVGFTNDPMLRIDNNGGGAAATALDLRVEPGQPPMTVGSSAKVANLNSDKLDGLNSGALGVTSKGQSGYTHVCATKINPPYGQWNECTPITVKVPAGKRYNVTVLSSLDASSSSNTTLTYCTGFTHSNGSQSCLGLASSISLAANYAESGTNSSRIENLSAGTYTFSTLVSPGAALTARPSTNAESGVVTTRVFVTDASAPGPPIE